MKLMKFDRNINLPFCPSRNYQDTDDNFWTIEAQSWYILIDFLTIEILKMILVAHKLVDNSFYLVWYEFHPHEHSDTYEFQNILYISVYIKVTRTLEINLRSRSISFSVFFTADIRVAMQCWSILMYCLCSRSTGRRFADLSSLTSQNRINSRKTAFGISTVFLFCIHARSLQSIHWLGLILQIGKVQNPRVRPRFQPWPKRNRVLRFKTNIRGGSRTPCLLDIWMKNLFTIDGNISWYFDIRKFMVRINWPKPGRPQNSTASV